MLEMIYSVQIFTPASYAIQYVVLLLFLVGICAFFGSCLRTDLNVSYRGGCWFWLYLPLKP